MRHAHLYIDIVSKDCQVAVNNFVSINKYAHIKLAIKTIKIIKLTQKDLSNFITSINVTGELHTGHAHFRYPIILETNSAAFLTAEIISFKFSSIR